MKRRNFFKWAGVSVLTAIVPNTLAGTLTRKKSRKKGLNNPFQSKGKWYKAALHVHTTNSDGDVDVTTRLKQYRNKGFQVVAVTDHRTTNDLSGYSNKGFLALSSIEFHPDTYSGAAAHHFLGYGLPHPYKYDNNLSAQEIINDIKSKGAKVFYAHPYWTGHSYVEMTEVSGFLGLEVFNYHCENRWGSGLGTVHWDQLLNNGHVLSGLATDDVHHSEDVGKAWTMIKAAKLNESSILEALEKSEFYASQGPEIKNFQMDRNGKVKIECSEVEKIVFRTSGAANGKIVKAGVEGGLNHAEWDLSKKKPMWVRCEVTDKKGNMAWTNPIFA